MSEVHLPHVEVPEPEHVTDSVSRYIAIAIVVATLATAVVGFLHSRADKTVEGSAVKAQRLGIEGMGALLRSQQLAQTVFNTNSLEQEQRAAASSAFQRYLFTPVGEDRQFKLQQTILNQLATGTGDITSLIATDSDLPDITAGGAASPEQDPAFPSRFFAKSAHDATRLRALQDAENEYRSAWEGRTATYTAILTVLAVALFLFGLSLTLGSGVRRLFAVVGSGLVVVGVLWAGLTAASPPKHAPDAAASAYARGHEELQTASDPAGYRDAADELTQAIDLRPTFALAYVDRSEALFRAGSPQSAGLASISTPEALQAATDDLMRARDLGLSNSLVTGNLGFYTFELGIQRHDQGLLNEAIRFTEEAAEEQPRNPAGLLNVAVTLLAAGRTEESHEAYRRAVAQIVYTDPAKKETRGDPGTEEFYVGGALTDLETVARYRHDLAGEVARIKSYVVGSVAAESVEAFPDESGSPETTQQGVTADVFPAEVQWESALPDYDDTKNDLSVQWYYLDRKELGWAALPNVSGVESSPSTNTEGGRFQLRSFLGSTSPPQCLPDGRYRVELYVDGTLVGTGEDTAEFGDLQAVAARDLNVALCRPPDWTPAAGTLSGLVTGYTNDDGTRGAYVFRYNRPSGLLTQTDAQQSVTFLDGTMTNFSSIFPKGTPQYSTADGTDRNYFMGLNGSAKRYYTYDGGFVRGGAGVSDDGAIIVAVVFGPSEDFAEGGLGLEIFDSLSVLENVPAE